MYEIFVETQFSAAHHLRNYPGDCERLHGHNWTVEVAVRVKGLNEIDVGIDFRDLKRAVAEVLSELDHTNLNEHLAFRDKNPSSERLAAYIHSALKKAIEGFQGVRLARVTVRETAKTGVTYWEEP